MEETRNNQGRFGMPVLRERSGHESAGELFFARRERQFLSGVLSEEGHNGHYVLFQPSKTFARFVGESVLNLNDALDGFRHEAADHLLFLEGDRLQSHYGELDERMEKARDKLVALTEYCNRGFDGKMEEALGSLEAAGQQGLDASEKQAPTGDESGIDSEDVSEAAADRATPEVGEIFEAVRQRSVKAGIMTDTGWKEGWVPLRPCSFYGRFMSEIILTLNDALRRVEGRTWYYIVGGENDDVLRQYYQELRNGMTALGSDLEEIIEFCERKVV